MIIIVEAIGLFYGSNTGTNPTHLKYLNPQDNTYSDIISIFDYRSGTMLKDPLNICFVDD